MKKYYISDLHFFHKNITNEGMNFDNRPFDTCEEMHAYILERWNSKVNNGDIVYILGDVAMPNSANKEDLIALISRLKGRKHLILGNHDKLNDYRLEQLFEVICDYKETMDYYDNQRVKIIMLHYPILMWKDQHKGSVHLYGHVHCGIEEEYFQRCLNNMRGKDFEERRKDGQIHKPVAYNVGCMMSYMNYEPRTLEEIIDGRNSSGIATDYDEEKE